MASYPRRIFLAGILIGAAGLSAGCNMSSDIPVVQFPDGQKPNPPAAPSKADTKGRGAGTVSKGDPSVDTR